MDSTNTTTAANPRKRYQYKACSGNTYSSLNLDGETRSRLRTGVHLITHTLDAAANCSTVARIATAFYLEHLQKICKKLATLSEDSEAHAKLRNAERGRVYEANEAGKKVAKSC